MIHFVYRVPPTVNPSASTVEKWCRLIVRKAGHAVRADRRTEVKLDARFVSRAPFSITAHLYEYLARRAPTRLYDLAEHGRIAYKPNDVILGHPWMEPNTIVQNAIFDRKRCRLRALIFPIHHGIPSINYYARSMVERADIVFGIMGPYWYDTLDRSEFASWKRKIVRLDMALDLSHFPKVKKTFNPPGKRGYLYIGRNAPEKGPGVLSDTMAGLRDFSRGWIGSGEEIANVDHIDSFAALTPAYVGALASKYDFFVNTSVSDANPTTILEAMAWGFPVACTPQSGYHDVPTLISLSTTDIQGNIEKLLSLQQWPEDRLRELAEINRDTVKTTYTWDRFCSTVWRHLEGYL